MKLFAAVLPPPEAVHELARVTATLHMLPGADTLRWTGRAGWHYTLAFMGQVDDTLIPALEAGLAHTARHHEPFELSIAGGGFFGGKVLWAGAGGQLTAMAGLAADTRAAAQQAGIAMEEYRPYVPHLTLATRRTATGLRRYADALAGHVSDPWTVRELVLVRSGTDPRYEVVAAWPLASGT
ncbi:RNA 2',3'-cyclic phosphodiesterase [Streptomyces sp. NPDC051320]|uniref:RNA 2',3'-cyclic phosphodiesterase n=1 Tax=Streptomyces sp. NPDC051320 TaxID=3154644 RepID=UPI00341E22BF